MCSFVAKLDSVKTYMRMRRVPEHLKIKVIKWFDYLWMTQKSADEDKCVGFLPGEYCTRPCPHYSCRGLLVTSIRIFSRKKFWELFARISFPVINSHDQEHVLRTCQFLEQYSRKGGKIRKKRGKFRLVWNSNWNWMWIEKNGSETKEEWMFDTIHMIGEEEQKIERNWECRGVRKMGKKGWMQNSKQEMRKQKNKNSKIAVKYCFFFFVVARNVTQKFWDRTEDDSLLFHSVLSFPIEFFHYRVLYLGRILIFVPNVSSEWCLSIRIKVTWDACLVLSFVLITFFCHRTTFPVKNLFRSFWPRFSIFRSRNKNHECVYMLWMYQKTLEIHYYIWLNMDTHTHKIISGSRTLTKHTHVPFFPDENCVLLVLVSFSNHWTRLRKGMYQKIRDAIQNRTFVIVSLVFDNMELLLVFSLLRMRTSERWKLQSSVTREAVLEPF